MKALFYISIFLFIIFNFSAAAQGQETDHEHDDHLDLPEGFTAIKCSVCKTHLGLAAIETDQSTIEQFIHKTNLELLEDSFTCTNCGANVFTEISYDFDGDFYVFSTQKELPSIEKEILELNLPELDGRACSICNSQYLSDPNSAPKFIFKLGDDKLLEK